MARTTRAKLGVGSSRSSSAQDSEQRKRALELAKRNLGEDTVVGRPDAPWTVLVYGESGVGKTTLLCQIPGMFLVPVERGANQTVVPQWKNAISSMDELDEVLDVLRHAPHEYRAVGIETLDAVESLVKERIENRLAEAAKGRADAPRSLAEWNETERGAGWEAMVDEWRSLLARLDALREERGMLVVLSAHAKIDTVPTLDAAEDFKRYAPQVSGRKSLDVIKGWCDFTLFLKTQVYVSKEKNKVMAASGERHMHLTQQATHDAKCRGTLVYPDRLLLTPDGGWRTFERVAKFVLDHGAGKAQARMTAALRALPQERAAAATKVFDDAFGRRDYLTCAAVVDAAEAEGRETAKTTTKVETKAMETETKPAPANGAQTKGQAET